MSNRGALIDSTQSGLFEPPTIAKLLSVGDAISERWCHLQLRKMVPSATQNQALKSVTSTLKVLLQTQQQ